MGTPEWLFWRTQDIHPSENEQEHKNLQEPPSLSPEPLGETLLEAEGKHHIQGKLRREEVTSDNLDFKGDNIWLCTPAPQTSARKSCPSRCWSGTGMGPALRWGLKNSPL